MDNTHDEQTCSASPPPVARRRRHLLVDALRGFALLGIVVVNVEFILDHADVGWVEHTSRPDLLVRWLVTTLAELKVYPLFALLFGYGISVQLQHAADSDRPVGPRYGRRMVGLVVLGVAHAALFFPGDILVLYAIVGSLAFILRGQTNRVLIGIAATVYAAASVLWLLAGMLLLFVSDIAESPSAASFQTLGAGSFAEVVGQHLSDWPVTFVFLGVLQGPAAFAFVLLGIVLGRTSALTNPGAYHVAARTVLLRGGVVGLIGGGIGAAMMVHGGRYTVLGLAISFLVAPALSAAYVALLMLAWHLLPRALATLLQAGGKMSLSIYLLQSIALSTLAYGYGAGLFESLHPGSAVMVAVGVWGGLSLFAVGWLRYAPFGPAEWALRSFSYWRIQPLLTRPRR